MRPLPTLLTLAVTHTLAAADPVFSGPQPGEKITPFQVLSLRNPASGEPRNPVPTQPTHPVALVFVHQIERSLVPLLRTLDSYGASRSNHLRTEIVFLHPDKIAGAERVKAASTSLQLLSPVGLSPDGAEGPGNYGLNRDCLMTVVAARSNVVVTNFALVQPGIADAPRIVAALASLSGDTNPPTAQALLAAANAGRGNRRDMAAGNRPNNPASPGKDPFPGAVPTDEKLQSLLRQFIRPTNDNATVDRLLAEVKAHIKDNPDLHQQAIDGWTRVLHFGDRYGNEYSRKIGTAFLESLKKP